MYTDKAYLVKDRFREKGTDKKSVNTIYRQPPGGTASSADPDLYPIAYGGKPSPHVHYPPGLENLYNLKRVYLIKRLEMFENDVFRNYKGEIIDDQGNRIFLITSAAHHTSDEVIHYGKHHAVKKKGEVNYGALNYAGIQLFEIHGQPEKVVYDVIRVGPGSGVWGEIQVIPGEVWNRIRLNCCCIRIGAKKNSDEAEIRVVVLKKDNRAWVETHNHGGDIFKKVYTLRGKVARGCQNQNPQNFLYKKTFDLQIYVHDPFEEEKSHKKVLETIDEEEEEDSEEDSDEDDDETPHVRKEPKSQPPPPPPKTEEKPTDPEPIGRICSQALHEKLNLHLPVLEFPSHMSAYDKLTLMGTFFLFNLKI